jgi:thymidylate kinase
MLIRSLRAQPIVVSFSGVDGAGKSTQIHHLQERLAGRNLRTRIIAFWDEVACLRHSRSTAGSLLFQGDTGIGKPDAPVRRRDKNVQSGLMTALRYLLYFADALAASQRVRKARRSDIDVVIFDRFIYDELANLNPRRWINRVYLRVIMKVVPRPDISFILDAVPAEARARKPEYPIDFVVANRDAYLALSALIGGMKVISPMALEPARQAIYRELLHVLPLSKLLPVASCVPVEL